MVAKLRTHNRFSQRADEALRDAVAFGLPHEARGTFDAEERDLLLKIVGQVVRPVVVTQPQPTGHAFADAPEAFADALADREGLEAGPALGGMKTDHSAVQWSTATKTKAGPSATVTVAGVPHITSGASVVMVPSCAFGPCA